MKIAFFIVFFILPFSPKKQRINKFLLWQTLVVDDAEFKQRL